MQHQQENTITRFLELAFLASAACFFSLSPVTSRAVTGGANLMLVLGLGFFLLDRRPVPSREIKWLAIGFGAYLVGALLSLVNAQNWHTGDWGLGRYYRFLGAVPAVIFITRARRTPLWAMVAGAAAGGLTGAIYSYHQVVFKGLVRVGLHGFNENRFGELAFVNALILSGAMILIRMGWRRRLLLGASALLAIYAGACSGSRAALFSFVGASSVLIYRASDLLYKRARALILAGSFFAAVALFGSLLTASHFWRMHLTNMITMPIKYLHHEYHTGTSSIQVRMALAQGGLIIWRSHPFLGTGLGDTGHDMKALARAGRIPGGFDWGRLHDSYVDVLARTGLVGMATFLGGILIIPFFIFTREWAKVNGPGQKAFAAACGSALVVFFSLDAMASSCFYNKGVYTYLVALTLLLGLALRSQERS